MRGESLKGEDCLTSPEHRKLIRMKINRIFLNCFAVFAVIYFVVYLLVCSKLPFAYLDFEPYYLQSRAVMEGDASPYQVQGTKLGWELTARYPLFGAVNSPCYSHTAICRDRFPLHESGFSHGCHLDAAQRTSESLPKPVASVCMSCAGTLSGPTLPHRWSGRHHYLHSCNMQPIFREKRATLCEFLLACPGCFHQSGSRTSHSSIFYP